MRRCLELAAKGRGRVSPNPMVGAVVLNRAGKVVGEGWHRGPGKAHAEVDALRKVPSGQARGGTLYVNLEPCHHVGRTGPCSQAVLEAGIRRVVIAGMDPIQGHGGGAAWLKKQGVQVNAGVLKAEAEWLNRGFYSVAQRKRPWTIVKIATSMDGKIATATGQSQWITGPDARKKVMELRAQVDVVGVGIETVLADDCQLTVRGIAGAKQPTKLVVDSRLRLPKNSRVLKGRGEVIVGAARSGQVAGAEVIVCGRKKQVDLLKLWNELAKREMQTVMVEGGGTLIRSLLEKDLVDEVHWFCAPIVVGDGAKGWVSGPSIGKLEDAWQFRHKKSPELCGADLYSVLVRAR